MEIKKYRHEHLLKSRFCRKKLMYQIKAANFLA